MVYQAVWRDVSPSNDSNLGEEVVEREAYLFKTGDETV